MAGAFLRTLLDGTCGVVSSSSLSSLRTYALTTRTSLTAFEAPAATSVGTYAFYYCSGLVEVALDSAETIGDSAFFFCTGLELLDLPCATSIGARSFQGCSALAALILRCDGVCTLSNSNAFTSTPIESGTGYIYVPEALLESYQAATYWSTYADQFRAIEDYPDVCG